MRSGIFNVINPCDFMGIGKCKIHFNNLVGIFLVADRDRSNESIFPRNEQKHTQIVFQGTSKNITHVFISNSAFFHFFKYRKQCVEFADILAMRRHSFMVI